MASKRKIANDVRWLHCCKHQYELSLPSGIALSYKAVHYWHYNYAATAEVALIGMAAGAAAAADTADAALAGVIVGTSETCSITLPQLGNLQLLLQP